MYHLPKDEEIFNGKYLTLHQGVIWQYKTHKNWLERRRLKELPFSHPGFAWAANKTSFPNYLYDKNIIGSGDTFMVDCLLNSWDIHGFAKKFTPKMKIHMERWAKELPVLSCDFIPQSIYHLYHGSLKNRAYMDRHDILIENEFDPETDIKLVNNVYEWATEKPNIRNAISQYFINRKEDEE